MLSVEQLRKLGYKVYVTHYRFYKDQGSNWLGQCETEIDTHGGETLVQIRGEDGTWYNGLASCSRKDQYNRKLGLRIALGRALKRIGLPTK